MTLKFKSTHKKNTKGQKLNSAYEEPNNITKL